MTSRGDAYRGIVDAVDRLVNRGDEADAILRAVVDLLHERLDHVAWAGISLVEGGELELGPARGTRATGSSLAVSIDYDGRRMGELSVDSAEPNAFDDEDRRALGRIATLVSQHALVGWDNAGEAWKP